MLKVSHTHTRSHTQLRTLSQNLLKLSMHTMLTNAFATHIARIVLYLSAGQRSHTQSPRHCLVSEADNTTPEFLSPD